MSKLFIDLGTLIAINWNVNWTLIIYYALAINGKLMDELDDNYMFFFRR